MQRCEAHANRRSLEGPRRDCRAALLTARGRGALATIVVAGPDAHAAVRTCFQPATPQPAADLPRDRILFGHWALPGALRDTAALHREELIVCPLAPDRLEIHCHGGLAVVSQVLESLQRAGCAVMSSARWLLGQEPDRLRAEARLALAHARTPRVAGILLDQHRGALSQAVQRIEQALNAGQTHLAESQLRALRACSPLGLHLIEPWRIAIVGRANVGKSSLLNTLLGYARALVHPLPGTTRDVLTAGTAVDGWPVEFADTAGTRATADPIELAGMQRATRHATRADLILLVSDLSTPWTADDRHWFEWAMAPSLVVHNKSDLVTERPSPRPDGMVVSARTGAGVAQLLAAIASRLVPHPPPAGTPVPFRLTHFRQLTRALQWLTADRREQAMSALQAMTRKRPPAGPVGEL